MRRPKGEVREIHFQYGFRPANGDTVVCSSLQEAQFFVANGATLLTRQIETFTRPWEELS